ncbi:PREDICTED: zinc finger BED domain-containing protein 1-like [Rhagoletis zephyria]|uniref:zinc finger BED domain-containing protein 1-like n=1 Tax=Rhagoletis zephyria TaxID=28612 RepID=UPI0008114DE5|nr:PREDICTED: zinc finger BED domain-containing protein 1-like [Rhagoletis zephyria]
MIASDIQPFRIVEDKGFREFVQCLDPRYKLPSRPTIQNVHLQKIFDDLEKKLQANLNNIDSCAITTDGWSSKANESYITVTCHFIDSEFKLRSVVLGTWKLANELNHSAENISQSLRECLNKWNILEKVNYVVTDNAASMLKACELLEKKNLPCFAHSINLVVQDALSTEKVKVILTKCKRIVAYFKSSTIAYARLRKEQGDGKQYSLIQEVPTRWNSAFAMMQRILVIKDAIFSVLLSTPKAPQVFTADEVEQLEDFIRCTENELAEVKRITASTLEGDIQEPSTSKSMEVPEIYEFMKEKLSCKIKSNRADSIIALREYAEKPNEPLNSDPLEYWKTRTSDMRHLQILALRYLCIPATSSESERMFSKAGAVISDRRTRLKEKNVNMLLFINKNSWMIS